VLLGKTAVKGLFPELEDKTMYDLRQLKGVVYGGVRTFMTYHPSALLRDPKWHSSAIEDFKNLEKEYSDALFTRKILEQEEAFEELPF
jgi:uracil-DNA glycosylase